MVWVVAESPIRDVPLEPPAAGARVLALRLRSAKATMLVVDLKLLGAEGGEARDVPAATRPRGGAAASGMRTAFVVEWEGVQDLHFLLSGFGPDARPASLAEVRGLRLEAGEATFPGSELAIESVRWLDAIPPVAVHDGEALLEDYTSYRFWDPADWRPSERHQAGPGRSGLRAIWFYGEFWRREGGDEGRLSLTRRFDRDISGYQAVVVYFAAAVRALVGVRLRVDGREIVAADRRTGTGAGEELRVPVSGRTLESITFELDAVERDPSLADREVTATLHWVMLERRGFDPARASEVRGMDPVPDRADDPALEVLPVGILFGREALDDLRVKIGSGEPSTLYADILAEVAALEHARPERFVGRYLPTDWGRTQGAGRLAGPRDGLRDMNSAMVYGGLVYALERGTDRGLRAGLAARRALLSMVRIDEWATGFVSRIPVGLPGYRAPFEEAHVAECAALCCDLIHPLLSEEERREVEDALYTKGIAWMDLYLRLHGEGYLLGSNQGAVYARGLIWACLVARRSHPDVDAIAERWTAWLFRMIDRYYRADGSTVEGPGYWEYTTHAVVAALLAIARRRGVGVETLVPAGLRRSLDYLLAVRSEVGGGLRFLPIADCGLKESVYMGPSFLFFARHAGAPEGRWLYDRYLAGRRRPPGGPGFGTPGGQYVMDALLTMLLLDDAPGREPKLPAVQRFAVCDRVLLRSGQVTLFFEGGPQVGDHTHPDKGQYIVEAYGERLAADPGMCDYADPAHLSFKASFRHNLVTVDGKDQSYRDAEKAVVIRRLDESDRATLIDADLSGSYRELASYDRTILFVRAEMPYVVVVDEAVLAEGEAGPAAAGGAERAEVAPELAWNFHARGSIEPVPAAGPGRFIVTAERAGMHLLAASPRRLEARFAATETSTTVFTRDLSLRAGAGERSLRIAALLAPYPSGSASAIAVEAASEAGGVTFTVRGRWGRDVVACRFGEAPRLERS